MTERQIAIGVMLLAGAAVLYLVLRRRAPEALLDDGPVPLGDGPYQDVGAGPRVSGIVTGIGTGLTGIAASIAEAVQ